MVVVEPLLGSQQRCPGQVTRCCRRRFVAITKADHDHGQHDSDDDDANEQRHDGEATVAWSPARRHEVNIGSP
jgi:hypothetical protein